MRNICSINLMNISNSGSLNSAAGTDELILQIIPLLSQKTNFKVEITKSGGGVVTSGTIAEKDGWITYIVPSAYYAKAGTMKVRLIAEEETSDYVLFSVPADIEGDVQVKWNEAGVQFVIDSIGRNYADVESVDLRDEKNNLWGYADRIGRQVSITSTLEANRATYTTAGWRKIGTIPESMRPIRLIRTPAVFRDLAITTGIRITEEGVVEVYYRANESQEYLTFSVSYPIIA